MHPRELFQNKWLIIITCIVTGLLFFIAVRFFAAKPKDAVHYHANFALYVNGAQDKFEGPGYYEEVQACSTDHQDDPKSRVHMHDNVNHVVHVHDHAVTWGDFFANIGYTLGDTVLVTNRGTFANDEATGNKLSFVLNGKPVDSIADKVIGDKDALLINFGNDNSDTLQQRYNDIPKDAEKVDQEKDPAACGGASSDLTSSERFKQAVEFWQ